ncbi:MAG: type II secretion system protein, partial [Limisphaerales bacterium]
MSFHSRLRIPLAATHSRFIGQSTNKRTREREWRVNFRTVRVVRLNRQPAGVRPGWRRRKGFTLIELLVVIAI